MVTSWPVSKGKALDLSFATRDDIEAVRSWRIPRHEAHDPMVRDAVDFAHLAVKRWREAASDGAIATSLAQLRRKITDHDEGEVYLLLVARAAWLRKARTVGVSLLRRTWCNNICLHFLARRPERPSDRGEGVRGAGTALLYGVLYVAAEIDARSIWGEATQNSDKYYADLLARQPLETDLLSLAAEEYRTLKAHLEKKAETRRDTG